MNFFKRRRIFPFFLFLPFLSVSVVFAADPPLISAIKNGKADQFSALLSSGADVTAKDQSGYTAVMWAVTRGNADMVKALLAKGAVLPKDSPSYSPLIEAAKQCNNSVAAFLVGNGANANVKDAAGETPLMWSAQTGCAAVAEILLSSGSADANAVDSRGRTPLIGAAQSGRTEVVTLLLSHGAKVDAADRFGYTALIWAAHNGFTDAVKALLAAGANPSIKGKDGFSARAVANARNHPEAAAALPGP